MLFTLGNSAMLPLAGNTLTKEAGNFASLLIAGCIIVPQLVVAAISPTIGALAEQRGRRLVLLIGFCTLPVRGVLFATLVNPAALVLIQALDGIAGACVGILVPLIASDIAGRSGRFNLSMGFIGLAIGVGATISTDPRRLDRRQLRRSDRLYRSCPCRTHGGPPRVQRDAGDATAAINLPVLSRGKSCAARSVILSARVCGNIAAENISTGGVRARRRNPMGQQPTRRSVVMAAGMAVAAAALPLRRARSAGAAPEPAYRTAGELVKALADRQVSSRELVDAAISRIEALDPKINAVVVRDFERARDAADGRRRRAGAGRTPAAARPADDGQGAVQRRRPADHLGRSAIQATGSRRPTPWPCSGSRMAGAIILGKTNVPLHLTDWQSYNEVYGTTNNPWDLSRGPGGSSGGVRGGARRRLRAAGTRLGHRRLAARAGAFLRRLLAQAEPRPRAAARLGLPRNPGDPGARRPCGDRPDGAQRRRPRPRTGGHRRTGRIGARGSATSSPCRRPGTTSSPIFACW